MLSWLGIRFAPADHRCDNFTACFDHFIIKQKAFPLKLIIACTIHAQRLLVRCSLTGLRLPTWFCTLPYARLVHHILFLCLIKLDHAKPCASITVYGQRNQQQENDPGLHRGILSESVSDTGPRIIMPKNCRGRYLDFYSFNSSRFLLSSDSREDDFTFFSMKPNPP